MASAGGSRKPDFIDLSEDDILRVIVQLPHGEGNTVTVERPRSTAIHLSWSWEKIKEEV